MEHFFFSNWDSLLRAFVLTILAYIVLIVFIRVSGKRTLSKMNAFDFVVTIALGSCLATVALNKNITLAEGALVYFLLIAMQFIITWTSVRSARVKRILGGSPVMLLYRGEMLEKVMKDERITVGELYGAARAQGISNLKDIEVIVLEPTGDLTVIRQLNTNSNEGDTLSNVENYPMTGNKNLQARNS